MKTGRRAVVLGAAAMGAGAVLAACGAEENSSSATTSSAANPDSSTAASPPSHDGVEVGQVPVGGGLVSKEGDFVVTQPQAGEFKAFSATCTHKGCTVAGVSDGTISCPCHGSKFSINDGAPVAGPATKPLPQKAVQVDGDVLMVS